MYLCVLSILQGKTFKCLGFTNAFDHVFFLSQSSSNQGLSGNLFGHISHQRDESQGGVWEAGIVVPPETWGKLGARPTQGQARCWELCVGKGFGIEQTQDEEKSKVKTSAQVGVLPF